MTTTATPAPTHQRRAFWLALAIIVLAAIPRLLIVAAPITTQLDKTLPDDAYYYFLTAQNLAENGSASVDGLHPSNGWHPLWLLINTAIFAPDYADPNTPVRIALAIGALCDALAAGVLFLAVRRMLGSAPAVIGAGFYALNVMPIFQAVNGLETGLTALMLALAWVTTLNLIEHPTMRRAIPFGVVFGLCFLARTDTALVLVFLGVFALWKLRRTPRLIVVGGASAVIVIAPWLVINQLAFGSAFEQTSSSAVPWAAQTRWLTENPDQPLWQLSVEVITYPIYWLRGDYLGAPPFIGFVLWIIAAFGIIRARRSAPDLVGVTLMLILGGAALLIVHTMLRWYPRPWYFVVTAQSLALGLALFWFVLEQPLIRFAVAVVAGVGMAVGGFYMWQIGLYPWQTTHLYGAAVWARDNTPPDALLGSLNSGVIGYYSGRATVNLDGVVNPDAIAASRNFALLDFMQAAGIDYLLDTDNAVHREYAMFMGEDYPEALEETGAITPDYPGLGPVRAYRVLPDGGEPDGS